MRKHDYNPNNFSDTNDRIAKPFIKNLSLLDSLREIKNFQVLVPVSFFLFNLFRSSPLLSIGGE